MASNKIIRKKSQKKITILAGRENHSKKVTINLWFRLGLGLRLVFSFVEKYIFNLSET